MAENPYLSLVDDAPEPAADAPPAESQPEPQAAAVNPYAQLLDQDEDAKNAQVGALFEAGLSKQTDRHASVLEIARQTGVPADVVEQRFDEFKQSAEASKFDPAAWREANPTLAKELLDRPELAPVVMRDEQLSVLTKAFRAVHNFFEPGQKRLEAMQEAAKRGATSEEINAIQAPPAKPLWETRQVPLATDPSASEGTFSKVRSAFENSQKQIDYSQLGYQILARRADGQDAYDLEKKAVDLKNQISPRYYNAGPLAQILVDAAELAPSQLSSYVSGGKLAAIAGGAAGLLAFAGTRNPVVAKEAAVAAGSIAFHGGGALSSFRLESGGAFLEYRDLKTDDGKTIPESTAIGASMMYGAVAALVETASMKDILKGFGPLGDAIAKGEGKAFTAGLLRDQSFRAIAEDVGKRWLTSAHAEAREEFIQQVAQDVIGYFAKVKTAWSTQKPDLTSYSQVRSTLMSQKADFEGALEGQLETYAKTLAGSLASPLSVGKEAIAFGTQVMARDGAQEAAQHIQTILGAKDSPTVKAAPDVVAKLIENESAASGEPITHLYVDPGAFKRLFQNNHGDADEGARALLGEDGPRKLQEAEALGQKLEVPLADYLEKWGTKPIGEALAEDTTTRPWHQTARELQENAAQIEQQAKAMADEALAKNEQAQGSDSEQRLVEGVRKQLEKIGTYSSKDALRATELMQSFIRTLAERTGKSADELFQKFQVSVAPAPEGAQAATPGRLEQSAQETLQAGIPALDETARARAIYADRTTGLLNERAFSESAAPADKPMVAILSVPGVKAINDNPDHGGHNKANGLFRMAGKALADVAGTAYKVGGDFRVYVRDQAELDQIVAQVNERMPVKGFDVVGALGATAEEAGVNREAKLTELRDAKAFPERGALPSAVEGKLGELSFPEEAAAVPVPSDLQAKAASLAPEAFHQEAYVDKLTGALTAEGWHSLPRKAAVASIDLSGLRVANEKLGKEGGNELLRTLATLADRLSGTDFDFAHLSGDEFAAQHDSPEALKGFVAELHALAQHAYITANLEDGGKVAYTGVQFWDGVGPDYDQADRALNRDKQDRQAKGEVRGGEDRIKRFEAGREGEELFDLYRRNQDAEFGREFAARRAAKESGRAAQENRPEVAPTKKTLEQSPKNLVVLHNLTAENLQHADELGGLAAPSLAITRKEHPLTGYGEITLVAAPDMADPKTGTPVFESDVYSPRYPETLHKVDTKATLALSKEMKPFADASEGYIADMDGELNREGANLGYSTLRPAFGLAFLTELGKAPDLEGLTRGEKHQAIADAIKAVGEDQFDAWTKEKLKEAVGDAYIPKGSRKIPYTLDNVLKEVTRKIRQGEDFNYGLGTARAAGTKKFSSLEQIQKARDKVIASGEFQALKDEMGKRFDALREDLAPYHPGRAFQTSDALVSAIGESYKRGRSLTTELEKDQFKGVPRDLVQKTADFAADLLAMPTEYFEAKPQRAVQLSEFKAAVVPSDASPAALETLKKHGLQIETYKRGDDADRQAAVERAATATNVLFQKGDEGSPRGYVDIIRDGARSTFNIFLGKTADKSTFLHESGHVFLEMMGDLAQAPDAPTEVKSDYDAILRFLGAPSREDIKTEHHEKFARGFEAYLREGKAPSSQLAAAFQRFRLWLVNVYRSVKSLNVELSPEVRGVFDRMLATDDEIARVRDATGLKPMFRSQEEAGMTPEQWQGYLADQERMTSQAARATEARMLRDQARETESWWKSEEGKLRATALEEYDAKPEVRARNLLTKGTKEGAFAGLGPLKLDKAAVVAEVGEYRAKIGFKGMLESANVKEGTAGIHPDQLAEIVGMDTGAKLLDALWAGSPDRTTWADEQAKRQMAERHPDIMAEKSKLAELVGSGLHNEHSSSWLLREWAALRSKAQQGVGTKGGAVPVEAIQRAASLIVERQEVGVLNSYRAQQAERGAAEKAALASTKGDFAQAYVFKQQQVLNHLMYRELEQARGDRDRFVDLAQKLSRDDQRARLGKASPAYRDGVDGILEALQLKEPEQREVPLAGLDSITAALQTNGETVAFDTDLVGKLLAQPKPWRELTVAEMRGVFGALKNLKKAATNRNTVLFEGRRIDRLEVSSMLMAEAAKNLPDKGPPTSSVGAMTAAQRGLALASGLDGNLLKPETMISWLAGGDIKSMWYRAVMLPLQEAKHREGDLLKQTIKPLSDAFSAIPKEMRGRMMDKIDGEALFPNHRADLQAPTRRFEVLMMLLNLGNDSNRQRLLEGRNIQQSEVLKAAEAVKVTKEEARWVQATWDAMDSLWPLVRDLEERDSGLAPERVKATPITVAGEQLKGGYFPAVYDRRVEPVGEVQAANTIASLMDPSYTRPGTSHSFTKSRVDNFSGAITLDPSVIQSHLAQVAHDLSFREAVKSVGGLVLDPGVQFALKRRLGDDRAGMFLQWVKDIGQQRGAVVASQATAFNRLTRAVKNNAAVAALGYSANVAIGDMANLFVGATVLEKKHWAGGMVDFFSSPQKMRQFALEKSGELRFRDDDLTRHFTQQVNSFTGKGTGIIGALKQHAFVFQEWSDKYTATPIWLGAYRQAIAAGEADKAAVTFADTTLRKIFPTHSAVDQSAAVRDKGWLGSSLMFYGYMNVLYNRQRDIVHDLYLAANNGDTTAERTFNTAQKLPVVTGQLMALWATASVAAELLTGRGREPNEEWPEWFTRKLLLTPFTSLPFVGNVLESAVLGKKPSVRAGPVFSLIENAGGAVQRVASGQGSDDDLIDTMIGAGVPLGVPRPVGRTAKYFNDVSKGLAPSGPADLVSGTIYGYRDGEPLNPITAVTKE